MINLHHRITDWIARGGIHFVDIGQVLCRFRQRLETESDLPIDQLEVNAAEMLSDLAGFLNLGVEQHDAILGQSAVDHLTRELSTQVRMSTQH